MNSKTWPWKLQFYFRAEDRKKFGEPGRMRGPGRRGDEVAVGDGFGHGKIDVGAACLRDVGANGGIRTALLPSQHTGGSQNLRGVTDSGDGFVSLGKVANDLDDTRIEPNVFGCAAAREDKRVIFFRLDLVKCGVQREIVASLFGVGLVAFEIMDGGANELTRLFARANSVNGVADHQQRLERDHHFVVFNVVADDHQNGVVLHKVSEPQKYSKNIRCPAEARRYKGKKER